VEQMEKKNGEKGERGRWPDGFLWRPGGAGGEEKGAGGPGSAPHGGREQGRERGPRARSGGTSRATGIGPWPTGAGSAVVARQGRAAGHGSLDARVADRRGRATSGPGGQRRGVGGSEREQGSVARGADRRAGQHSASRFGSKPIQTESKIFQMVQTDSRFFKL
jgi:hypothetical protein